MEFRAIGQQGQLADGHRHIITNNNTPLDKGRAKIQELDKCQAQGEQDRKHQKARLSPSQVLLAYALKTQIHTGSMKVQLS